MDYEELLQDYLDGERDEHREQTLFTALAHDTVLRREFGEYMRLRTAVRNEAAQAVPPADLTAAVFAAAGYAPVQSVAVPKSVPPLATYAAIALLSSLLTAMIVVLLLSPGAVPGNVPSGSAMVGSAVLQSASPVQPSVENHASAARDIVLPPALPQTYTLPSAESVVAVPDTGAADQDAVPPSEQDAPPPSITVAEVQSYNVQPSSERPSVDAMSPVAEHVWLLSGGNNALFECVLRSFATRSFPAVELPSQEQGSIPPIAVSALYLLSETHAVGISAGREAFAQEFAATLRGEQVTMRQNPVLWWAGATWRYTPLELGLWNAVQPFTQLTLGACETGPLGRMQLGMVWRPDHRLALSGGVESAAMVYPVEGTLYTTTKVGVFYGLHIRF